MNQKCVVKIHQNNHIVMVATETHFQGQLNDGQKRDLNGLGSFHRSLLYQRTYLIFAENERADLQLN